MEAVSNRRVPIGILYWWQVMSTWTLKKGRRGLWFKEELRHRNQECPFVGPLAQTGR